MKTQPNKKTRLPLAVVERFSHVSVGMLTLWVTRGQSPPLSASASASATVTVWLSIVVDVQHGVVVAHELQGRAAALAGDHHAGVPAVGGARVRVRVRVPVEGSGAIGVGEEERIPHVDVVAADEGLLAQAGVGVVILADGALAAVSG